MNKITKQIKITSINVVKLHKLVNDSNIKVIDWYSTSIDEQGLLKSVIVVPLYEDISKFEKLVDNSLSIRIDGIIYT